MRDTTCQNMLNAMEAMAGWGDGPSEEAISGDLAELAFRLERFNARCGGVAQEGPYLAFVRRLQHLGPQALAASA